MSITKKLAAGVVVLGLALAGCGSQAPQQSAAPAPGGGSGSGEQVTLRFAWWGNDTRNRMTQEIIEAFEAENPDIKVQGEPGEFSGYWDKLATQVAASDAPDVIQMDDKYIAEYGQRGALLDLESVDIDTGKFMDGTIDLGRVDGKLYGINAGINTSVILANPKVLADAGVEMPDSKTWTWDDLAELAKQITDNTEQGTYGMQNLAWIEPSLRGFLRQQGKDQYSNEGGMGFEAGDLAPFFEYAKKIQETGAAPSAAETSEDMGKSLDQTMSATNKLGFFQYWSNQVTALTRATGEELELLRPPSQTGKSNEAGLWFKASMLWSASAQTEHQEAAAKLIDFLANSEEAGKIMGTERGVPANTDVRKAIEADLSDVDKKVVAYMDDMQADLGPTPAIIPAGGGTFQQVQQRMVQDLIFDRKDPMAAAQELHDEVQGNLR